MKMQNVSCHPSIAKGYFMWTPSLPGNIMEAGPGVFWSHPTADSFNILTYHWNLSCSEIYELSEALLLAAPMWALAHQWQDRCWKYHSTKWISCVWWARWELGSHWLCCYVPWLKDGSLFGCLGPQCHLGHPAVQALGQQSLEGGHSGLQDLSQLLWSMDQWCLMVWWWWFSLGFLVLHLTEVGTILQSSQALCCQLPMEPNWHCLGSTGRWNPHVMVVTSLPGGPDAVGSPLQKGLQTLSKQLFKMQEWQKQWG